MPSEQAPAVPAPSIQQPSDVSFYIPATSSSSRPRQTLKSGDTFVVLDTHGDIGASAGGSDGLFNKDTRFLSHFEILLNGMQPLLLGSNLRDDNSLLSVDLTNPDIYFDKKIVLQKDTLHVSRTIFLWHATAHQRVAVRNHGERAIRFHLSFTFGSDFSDLFEVRGMRRARHGTTSTTLASPHQVVMSYTGLDATRRETTLTFEPVPGQLTEGAATYTLDLAPGENVSIFLSIGCDAKPAGAPNPFFRALIGAHHEIRAASKENATVDTSNELFNEVMCQAMSDMSMLVTQTLQGPYPYAGIPWYSTTFGRDGIIAAMEMLWVDPRIARGVLRRLAAFQATHDDPLADAEPGKILHEMRGGEMAALREIPFGLYYGSVDSTPLFVVLAGLYWQRTGDLSTLKELWPSIEAALAWIDGPGDPDRDGFVEYDRANDEGLVNQGWKDSQDAIFHADGGLAVGPIALAEVQGYVYLAKTLAAKCARQLGHDDAAASLETAASALAAKFENAFWCEDIGMYALALDGAKKQCAVRTSNAGQLLFTGMINATRAQRVAETLVSAKFFSGWGIRTVALEAARYNPMSYHNGSVWPHDNALIALGMAHYGQKHLLEHVFKGLFEAATYMELRRLPELFCGFRRRSGRGPTLYPVACAPQAWASGSLFMVLQASLGLNFNPMDDEIVLHKPTLPAFLDEVYLRDLRLGASSVDLAIHRHQSNVSVQVARSRGTMRVRLMMD